MSRVPRVLKGYDVIHIILHQCEQSFFSQQKKKKNRTILQKLGLSLALSPQDPCSYTYVEVD